MATATVLRGQAARPSELMGLFPPKKDEPLINVTAKMRRALVERVDWMAQREERSRNEVLEIACEKLIQLYEKENELVVGHVPMGDRKQRHRRSPKQR